MLLGLGFNRDFGGDGLLDFKVDYCGRWSIDWVVLNRKWWFWLRDSYVCKEILEFNYKEWNIIIRDVYK